MVGLPPVQRGTAMMFQSYALFPHLTCLDNVAFNLKMRGVGKAERCERAREMLQRVQMARFAERVPAELSGGQQQRIALAALDDHRPAGAAPRRAAVGARRVLAPADARRAAGMQREFGITFVHVTHTQPEAIAVADLVVVMNDGVVEQAGPARAVYDHPHSSYVARFMGGQNVLEGRVTDISGSVAVVEGQGGGRFEVPVTGPEPTIGEPLSFAIRRDKIETQKLGGDADSLTVNSVVGTVRMTEYQGSWVKVTMSAGADAEFVANVNDERFFKDPVREGDQVLASWQRQAVHQLAG